MITGAHAIIYTKDAEADRVFFRDILRFPDVDAGDGWLVFGLPPSEVAFHPANKNGVHELYLLCDDIQKFVADLEKKGVGCERVQRQSWGLLTKIGLPGGGKLGVYQPLHRRPRNPKSMATGRRRK